MTASHFSFDTKHHSCIHSQSVGVEDDEKSTRHRFGQVTIPMYVGAATILCFSHNFRFPGSTVPYPWQSHCAFANRLITTSTNNEKAKNERRFGITAFLMPGGEREAPSTTSVGRGYVQMKVSRLYIYRPKIMDPRDPTKVQYVATPIPHQRDVERLLTFRLGISRDKWVIASCEVGC